MFKQYFAELEINVKDWEGLFEEMNTHNGGNCAYIRFCDGKPAGFIQFTTVTLENWFFKEKLGFIRNFGYKKRLGGMATVPHSVPWRKNIFLITG